MANKSINKKKLSWKQKVELGLISQAPTKQKLGSSNVQQNGDIINTAYKIFNPLDPNFVWPKKEKLPPAEFDFKPVIENTYERIGKNNTVYMKFSATDSGEVLVERF